MCFNNLNISYKILTLKILSNSSMQLMVKVFIKEFMLTHSLIMPACLLPIFLHFLPIHCSHFVRISYGMNMVSLWLTLTRCRCDHSIPSANNICEMPLNAMFLVFYIVFLPFFRICINAFSIFHAWILYLLKCVVNKSGDHYWNSQHL